jgi:hypothetical protein
MSKALNTMALEVLKTKKSAVCKLELSKSLFMREIANAIEGVVIAEWMAREKYIRECVHCSLLCESQAGI